MCCSTIPYKVLYVFDEKALLYRRGRLHLAGNGRIQTLPRFPLPWLKRLAAWFRVTNRLLRLEPRAVERLSRNRFVLSFTGKIWIIDLETKQIKAVYEIRKGWSDVLNFCSDSNCLYWGEYGSNHDYRSVKIYRMNQNESVREIYSFPKGTIRHIHNIVYDKVSGGGYFWILTGDNEKNSGIYRASYDWENVSPVKTGRQCFRAVTGFPRNGGLVYATDSVTDINHIYHLSHDGSLKALATINGSCIYGIETLEYYIFSTTVESPEGRGLKDLFSYKTGDGILSREVHIIAVRKTDLDIKIIAKYKSDWLPSKMFQYPTAMFPKGQNLAKSLWVYVMACSNLDGKSLSLDLTR